MAAKRCFFLLLLLGVGFFSRAPFARADEALDFTVHHQYESARALGMGNAFTAVSDDYNALFYNPAGLAFVEEGNMNFFIQAGADSKILAFKSDLTSASGGASSDTVTNIANLIQNNYGNHYSLRLPSLGVIWARPRWAIAIIPADLSLELDLHQTVGPSISVTAWQDTTIAYGRGWEVHMENKDRFSLGLTFKAVYREYFSRAVSALEIALDSNLVKAADASEGMTLDADFGMMYKFHVEEKSIWRFAKPTLALTLHNMVDPGFPNNYHVIDKATTAAPGDGRRLDVGTMFELPDWWVFKNRLTIDERDMLYTNSTFTKGLHMGAEFLWKLRSWWQGGWRVGINQGYFTAGFTGIAGIFKLDLATYGVEVGPANSPQASRMYMARTSLDF